MNKQRPNTANNQNFQQDLFKDTKKMSVLLKTKNELEKQVTSIAQQKDKKLLLTQLPQNSSRPNTINPMPSIQTLRLGARWDQPMPSEQKIKQLHEIQLQTYNENLKKILQEPTRGIVYKSIWEEIKAKFPLENTEFDRNRRREIFKQWDPNHNGYLSLAEVDRGISLLLNNEQMFRAKPAIIRAFMAAKGVGNANSKQKNSYANDYIEPGELRTLLIYLRQYFEYFVMFEKIDLQKERRIGIEEFKQAMNLFKQWGVDVGDPIKAFKKIDINKGGKILFDEFADWAIRNKLDLQDDDDVQFEINSQYRQEYFEQLSLHYSQLPKKSKPPNEMKEVWDELDAKLPLSNSQLDKDRRRQIYEFDPFFFYINKQIQPSFR